MLYDDYTMEYPATCYTEGGNPWTCWKLKPSGIVYGVINIGNRQEGFSKNGMRINADGRRY